MRFGNVKASLVLGLLATSCATTSTFSPSGVEQKKMNRQYVGRDFVLASSMFVTDFFGDKDRLFAEARPFEIVEIYDQEGEKIPLGLPSETTVPAGTPVRVESIQYPPDSVAVPFMGEERPALTPTAHTWVTVERTGPGTSELPLVLVLPREISSVADFEQAMQSVLKSQQWVTSWLTLRPPEMLDGIYHKEPKAGMTWAGLAAAMGLPRNVVDKDREGMLEFVADYGDLQITIQGNVVREVVSVKAEAEAAQKKALAEAKRAAEEEAKRKAEAEELERQRQEQVAQERAAQEAAAREAEEAEAIRRETERQDQEAKAEAARREAELQARLAAAQRAKAEAEAERQRKIREAALAKKIALAEAEALVARKKAEAEAKKLRAESVKIRQRTQQKLADAEQTATRARKRAEAAEVKAKEERARLGIMEERFRKLKRDTKGPRKIGVKIQAVSAQLAAALGLGNTTGAFLTDVESGADGARAGLQANDVVLKVDGVDVLDPQGFMALLSAADAGRAVSLHVRRGTKTRVIRVESESSRRIKLEADALAKAQAKAQPIFDAADHARADADAEEKKVAVMRARLATVSPAGNRKIGVKVETVSPQLAAAFGLKGGQGAFVARVKRDGEAQRGGVTANDIVLTVNGKSVSGPKHFSDLVRKCHPLDDIELVVLRVGKRVSLTVLGSLLPQVQSAPTAKSETKPVAPPAKKAEKPRRAPPDPRNLDLSSTVKTAEGAEVPPSRRPVRPAQP